MTSKQRKKRQRVESSLESSPQDFQNETVLLFIALRYFNDHTWILEPSYQRQKNLWPNKQQIKLIQSVFDKVPIPAIFSLKQI